jgi:hypothetical protein
MGSWPLTLVAAPGTLAMRHRTDEVGRYISLLTHVSLWLVIGVLSSLLVCGAVAILAPAFTQRTTNATGGSSESWGQWAWLHYKRLAQVAYIVA